MDNKRSSVAIRLRQSRRYYRLAGSDDAPEASNGAALQPIFQVTDRLQTK
jgi:hypothetical protein